LLKVKSERGTETMKMGTAQKQNISVQHRMWNRYDSRPKLAIPEFSE